MSQETGADRRRRAAAAERARRTSRNTPPALAPNYVLDKHHPDGFRIKPDGSTGEPVTQFSDQGVEPGINVGGGRTMGASGEPGYRLGTGTGVGYGFGDSSSSYSDSSSNSGSSSSSSSSSGSSYGD